MRWLTTVTLGTYFGKFLFNPENSEWLQDNDFGEGVRSQSLF